MDKKLSHVIESTFKLEKEEGENKVVSLSEAIGQNIRSRMAIYVMAGGNTGAPNAAICEILRQYYGKSPNFTLILNDIGGTYGISLIHADLVKKLIFNNCSDLYPTPGPNPVIQRAFREKRVEFENWSVLSLAQRFVAGTWGLKFMPTKSLIGSSIAEENRDSFKMIDDPFDSGEKVGVVKALNPDISIVHGWAADRYGNTITPPFSVYSLWGAKAGRNGVIVTVEKLVNTDFIREHSPLVKIPGYLVNSVCVTPLGAHPQGLSSYGLEEFETYGLDKRFLSDFRKASEDSKTLDAWMKYWILNSETHEDYVRKLGYEKVMFLKGEGSRTAWWHELASISEDISWSEEFNSAERMVVAAAWKIKEIILKNNYKTMFGGIGNSALATWLAYYNLRKEGYFIDLTGLGIGYAPRPADPSLLSQANIPTSKMLADVLDIHGTCVTGENNSCLGVIGAAQIDKHGNINSSKIGEKTYIAGSGGSNDMASGAREVVVVAPLSPRRSVERVSYITCHGDRVRTFVSNMGIFKKLGGDTEFTLTQYFSDSRSMSLEERIERIKENCGWSLKVSKEIKEIPPPTQEELMILRLLDPKGYFLKV